MPKWPIAPGSLPPWPGSINTTYLFFEIFFLKFFGFIFGNSIDLDLKVFLPFKPLISFSRDKKSIEKSSNRDY